jgi:hypothetical protein
MEKERYLILCKALLDVHLASIKNKQIEDELRKQVLENSEAGSDIPMGEYTITFSPETTCRKIDQEKLRKELMEKFKLSKVQITCLIRTSETESVREKHIVIKQTAKMKLKTNSASKAA